MTRTTYGTLIGIVLGFAWAFGSFGQMLVVAVLGAIGFVVAKVLDGDIDVNALLPGRRDSR